MILSSDIFVLLEFFNFLIWIFYALNIVALFVLKRRARKARVGDAISKSAGKKEYKLDVK
jgi:hypothetical protein